MNKYPQVVQDYLKTWVPIMLNMAIEEGENVTEKHIEESVVSVIGEKALQNFLKTGDPTVHIEDEEEGVKLINNIFTNSIINKLRDDGFLDTIENENGEEIIFLTQKGKEETKHLKKQ